MAVAGCRPVRLEELERQAASMSATMGEDLNIAIVVQLESVRATLIGLLVWVARLPSRSNVTP